MGTGKTRVVLVYLQEAGFNRLLIGLPVNAAGVWCREIRVKLKLPWPGLNLTRRSLAERERALRRGAAATTVVLVNYNVLWLPKASALKDKRPGVRNRARAQKRLIDMLEKWKPDSVVLDEIHRIKGRSTRQSQYAARLARQPYVKRRIGLSGTPVTQGIEDLFAIYRFIDPNVFGTRWSDFAGHYLEMGGYFNHEIVGYLNEDEAEAKVAATSYIISKSEALDLPERQDVVVPFPLSARSRKLYEEFKKNSLAEISGLGEDGRPKRGLALARIVLTSMLRLQQMTSGFINTDKGIIDVGHEKLDMALDLISDALAERQQVVVFCHFHRDIERLAAALKNKAGVYAGGKYSRGREKTRQAFQRGRIKVLLVEISAGSESIELTAASVAIFYSINHSLKDYAQARDRLHRIGQKHSVTYYLMAAEHTIDETLFSDLGDKQDVASRITNLDYVKRLLT